MCATHCMSLHAIDQNNVDLPLVFGLLVGNLIKSSSDALLVEPDECQNDLNRDS